MAKLTGRALFVGTLANTDLIHVVDVSDTTQDPAGSSFKLDLLQLKTFIGSNSWNKDGNTVGSLKFLGTLDNFALPFRTNNTEKARITANGEFLVGTTSPLLTANVADFFKNQNQGTILFVRNNTDGAGASSGFAASANEAKTILVAINSASFSGGTPLQIANAANVSTDSVAGLNIGTSSSTPVSLWTNSTERIKILSTGEVGIGFTPVINTRLQVKGIDETSATFTVKFHNSTGANNGFVLRDDGFVGIGTAAPDRLLTLNAAVSTVQSFQIAGVTQSIIGSDGNGRFIIFDGAYRLTMNASGNFFINTTVGNTRFNIADSAVGILNVAFLQNAQATANDNAAQLILGAKTSDAAINAMAAIAGMVTDNTAASFKGALILSTSNNAAPAERARIDHLGNFGIGTSTFQASMVGGVTLKTGTAPTGSVTDQFAFYSADIVAGNAAPHFRTELGNVIKLFKSAAYTRNATVVEDRTLLASASATTINNNNVLAALIGDLQATGLLG